MTLDSAWMQTYETPGSADRKTKTRTNAHIKSFGPELITHVVRLNHTRSCLLASVCILYCT